MKSPVVFSVVSLLSLSLILLACGGASSPAPSAIAYVAHPQSHSLTVINIPADHTVSRIEIGNSSVSSLTQVASSPQEVAITPDGSRAYVTDGSTSVWAVDTSSNTIATKIDAGMFPEALVMSPDGKSVYVTSITCGDLLCSGPTKPEPMASVEVIDTTSNALKATITFGKTSDVSLSGIGISPDGSRVYVTQAVGGHLWVIDTATNGIVSTIALNSHLLGDVTVSPDGKTLYVIGETNGTTSDSYYIQVIDTQTSTPTTRISLENIGRLAITPDGSRLYVADLVGKLSVIDTTKNVSASIPVAPPNPLIGVAFTPDATRAYVTCGNNNTIYVLDTATNHVVNTLRSDYPGGLAITRGR